MRLMNYARSNVHDGWHKEMHIIQWCIRNPNYYISIKITCKLLSKYSVLSFVKIVHYALCTAYDGRHQAMHTIPFYIACCLVCISICNACYALNTLYIGWRHDPVSLWLLVGAYMCKVHNTCMCWCCCCCCSSCMICVF